MRYKMIFGKTLFSFFKRGKQDLLIKEVRFLNRDGNGEVNGSTRLLYDEDSGTMQRFVNGSAPIASLPDDMVCFLADVSRCFGRLSGDTSWEDDVWLCVDTEILPETGKESNNMENGSEDEFENLLPVISGQGMNGQQGLQQPV